MANLNKTKLDASQCIADAYDGVEEASRVVIAAATEFAIELSATDGDSVIAIPSNSGSSSATVQTPATASGTVLLTLTDVSSYGKCQVYCEALAGISVAGNVLLQVSPDTSGSFWATLGAPVPGPSAPGINVSSVVEFVAKRIRLVSNTAPTGGNNQFKIICKS